MPGYNAKALIRFQQEKPARQKDSPHPNTPPNYGAKVQYAKEEPASIQAYPISKIHRSAATWLVASQEDAILTYNASDLILAAHSDARQLPQ
ncbi:hypothetical protein THAOC_27701 [Thalassiosira oceanica]|uniref:Uncharacterized protein n=1 Tax=Thalassiosira oceanica TaxID=159749 RepID=K0RI86_THAOC|nr:hypothetical protein THAOC_27701 [Thalassiosira oceanica]|eukprot:EJK52955.1 hypothetical protein THAOC_27701 [Thalassiosira oceanica]